MNDAARRALFEAWFSGSPCNGDREALIRKSGYTKGRVSQLFDPNQQFGERAARSLAHRLGLPAEFFNSQGAEMSTGDAPRNPTGEGAAAPPAASNIQDTPYSRPNLRNLHQVPVIGTTQGGFPDRIWTDGDFPPGDSDSYAECSTSDENAFLCRVVGDSMAPRYRPGEFCLVEPNTEAEIEDDVLVRLVTGETMLKRLLGLRGGLRLGSYNDSTVYTYEPGEVRWYYYVAHGVPARKIRHRIETATYNGRDRRWVDAPGHPARRAEDEKK